VKPGIMEHMEQLTSQFMSAQKEFTAYKSRLNVVRMNKEQHHIEGKNKTQNLTCVKVIFTEFRFKFLYEIQLNQTLVNVSNTTL
jgi:hypothetical protein